MNKPVEELMQRLKEPDYKYYGCELSKSEAELVISALEKQMSKKPCDFCKNIYTIEATSYTYTEPIASLSGLSEINYCPKCGRPLNQPSATDNNVGE